MNNLLFTVADSVAHQDTITTAYANKWQAPALAPTSDAFFTSAELWPVVFGVCLIIWTVLLWNMYRMERRLMKLEKQQQEEAA
jgi:hypothetical protein